MTSGIISRNRQPKHDGSIRSDLPDNGGSVFIVHAPLNSYTSLGQKGCNSGVPDMNYFAKLKQSLIISHPPGAWSSHQYMTRLTSCLTLSLKCPFSRMARTRMTGIQISTMTGICNNTKTKNRRACFILSPFRVNNLWSKWIISRFTLYFGVMQCSLAYWFWVINLFNELT